MNLNMQKLFDSLRDGVALVSPACRVLYTNQTASRFLGIDQGKPLAAENLCQQIRAVAQGYVKLPLTLEVDAPGHKRAADHLRVTLLNSPVGSDYLVVVHNLTESQFYENTVSNLAELMNQELNVPFQGLVQVLEQLLGHLAADPDLAADPESGARSVNHTLVHGLADRLIERGGDVMQRLNQLLLLAETFSNAPMLDRERVLALELVSEALLLARPGLAARQIRVSLVGVGEGLPALYGSRRWLSRALAEYIQLVAAGAKQGAELLLSARGSGSFVTFHIQNCGLGIPAHLRERSFLPFHRGGAAPEAGGLGLGLALCKRVVSLHQGHVHVTESDGEIVELGIELPAGGFAEVRDPGGIEQAQRYAQDLARLMKRAPASVH